MQPPSAPLARVARPWLPLCLLTSLFAGCAASKQARSVERSGFLAPEVELREGSGDAPLLVYANPTGSLAGYDAVLIEPVEVWYGEAARRSGTSTEELEHLAGLLWTAMATALEPDYRIVDEPGPHTLRLRVALTDADAARPAGNVITTFVPQLRRLSTLGGRFLDVRLWTGAASVEGEVLDAVTGERLMAAIDRRIGTKSPGKAWDRWDDVRDAFDAWSVRLRERMRVLRSAGS